MRLADIRLILKARKAAFTAAPALAAETMVVQLRLSFLVELLWQRRLAELLVSAAEAAAAVGLSAFQERQKLTRMAARE